MNRLTLTVAQRPYGPYQAGSTSRRARKLSGFLVMALAAVVSAGCVSVPSEVDLQESRRENLRNDLQLLAQENVVLPDAPLKLAQCIELGLRNNLDLRVANFTEEVARDSAYADRLGMLPSLNLSGEASRRDREELVARRNVDTGVVTETRETSRDKERLTADLSLTWSVLDFGLSYVRARQAQLGVKALEFQHLRQAQLLALEITEAYWRAALAEDALDYTRGVEAELKQQKEIIDRSVASRRIDPITAKDAAKRLVDLQIIIRDLRGEVSGARVGLARLMGLRQNQHFTLAREAIRPLLAGLPRPHQLDVAHMEEYALLHRPELYQADIGQRIRRDDARAAMLNIFPDLTFGVGSHYDGNSLVQQSQWNTFGVNFLWDVLAVPAKMKRRSAALKGVEVVRHERMAETIGVMTQVNMSLLDYAVKIDRFLLLEESYTLTNDLLKMVRDSNKAGRVSNLAVTQRSLEDVAAKLKRDRSVVEAIVGYRRLLVSVGMDVHHWERDLADFQLLKSGTAVSRASQASPAALRHQTSAPAAAAAPVVAAAVDSAPVQARRPAPRNTRAITRTPVAKTAAVEDELDDQFIGTASVLPWAIQTGAFSQMAAIESNLGEVNQLVPRLVERAEALVDSKSVNGKNIYRARFVGFTKSQASQACETLQANGMECFVYTHGKQNFAQASLK